MRVSKTVGVPVFNPIQIVITFDTKKEYERFRQIVGSNGAISKALAELRKYSDEERDAIKQMLSDIYNKV